MRRRLPGQRFQQRYPRKAAAIRRRIDRAAAAFRDREAARSEVIRVLLGAARICPARRRAHRAGRRSVLSVDRRDPGRSSAAIDCGTRALSRPAARPTQRYRALPPYPTLIRGRFDPFHWAADPRAAQRYVRRAGRQRARQRDAITGFPGAAGIVEGRARVIATAEEGDQLQPGEILVTTVTNVGWTPLFPRAAAVVTDVGAPLSHAAIVARELGIPAVVGCGNATMRLHTGDRVRVNGGQGTVEVLRAADAD